MNTTAAGSLRRRWRWQQRETMATSTNTPHKQTMLDHGCGDDNNNEEKIAAFKELIRSTSGGTNDDDDDGNASLVSLDEERLGLIIGSEEMIGEDARDDKESGESVLDFTESTSSQGDAETSGDNDSLDDDLYDNEEEQSRCSLLLLARIKANPSLSISTLFMGLLTAYLWTDERFRFISIRNSQQQQSNRGQGSGSGGVFFVHKTTNANNKKRSGPISFPAFPAKALLGITVHKKTWGKNVKGDTANAQANSAVVQPMVEPPYSPSDFHYETKFGRNRILTYWDEVVAAIELSKSLQQHKNAIDDENDSHIPFNDTDTGPGLWANISSWGPCYPRALHQYNRQLRVKKDRVEMTVPPRNWTYIVQYNSGQSTNEESIIYPTYKKTYHSTSTQEETLGGLCRPGFLIIGQGKCGTSSLYHYLTGHPRIQPAKEKQIHYFRYHKSKPLEWYYSHFPTIESFLGQGALMTGEASPGYMPYPEVVEAVVKRLSPDWTPGLSGDGNDDSDDEQGVEAWKVHVRSLPKIIAIVRDPIDRAKSSYKYNYIEPALKTLRSGRGMSVSGQRIPGGKTEKYYRQHHLFSLEELIFAELATLKECLKPGGMGESWSTNQFGRREDMFFYHSIQRRNNRKGSLEDAGMDTPPPLIHLDEACYIMTRSKTVPRAQWRDLAAQHPHKILALPNLQLIQSIVGRGVYALPLEWWYEVFSHTAAAKNKNDVEDRIHVVCMEDMANAPEKAMEDVTKFLGLPEFDFTNVTSVGRYNVGGHRGYDTITKSNEDEDDDDGGSSQENNGAVPHHEASKMQQEEDELVTISDALRNELSHFYQPYNERLFQLIGKRCPWN